MMRSTCSTHHQQQNNIAKAKIDCNKNTCCFDIQYHPEQQEEQYECEWNDEYRSNTYRSFYASEMIGSSFRFLPSMNSQLDVIVEEAIVFFDDDGKDDDDEMAEQKTVSSEEGEEENSNPAEKNKKQRRKQCQDKHRDQEGICLNAENSVELNFASTDLIAKRVSLSSSLAKSSTNNSISSSAGGYEKLHLPEHKHYYSPEVTNATNTSNRNQRMTRTAGKSSLPPYRYDNNKNSNNFSSTSSLNDDRGMKSSSPSDSFLAHPYQGNNYDASTMHQRNGVREQQNQKQLRIDENNKTIEICPGIVLRLRGANETINAIKSDFYMPHSCCCCQKSIFCIQDADYVLCPDCRVVTPILTMDGNNQVGDGHGGVGLGFTFEDLRHYHEEIALTRVRSTTISSHPTRI